MKRITFTNPYGDIILHYINKNGDKCFKAIGSHFSNDNGRYAVVHPKPGIAKVDFNINLDDYPF